MGTTNPYQKDLKCAEKQLRQCQRRGDVVSEIVKAQLKVENHMERVLVWEQSSRKTPLSVEEIKKKARLHSESLALDPLASSSDSSKRRA